jgi:hypothetical protein
MSDAYRMHSLINRSKATLTDFAHHPKDAHSSLRRLPLAASLPRRYVIAARGRGVAGGHVD